jgi:hypothetical protein
MDGNSVVTEATRGTVREQIYADSKALAGMILEGLPEGESGERYLSSLVDNLLEQNDPRLTSTFFPRPMLAYVDRYYTSREGRQCLATATARLLLGTVVEWRLRRLTAI